MVLIKLVWNADCDLYDAMQTSLPSIQRICRMYNCVWSGQQNNTRVGSDCMADWRAPWSKPLPPTSSRVFYSQ